MHRESGSNFSLKIFTVKIKKMKRCLIFLIIILIFSCTPRDPEKVLQLVDEKIYYPSRAGLKSLICQANSPYIDEMFSRLKAQYPESNKILDQIKPEVKFYWRKGYGSQFEVRGIPAQLSALRSSVLQVFKGTDILIVPPTEAKQFEGLHLSLKKEKGKIEIMGTNPFPKKELYQYNLVVEPDSWLIVERKFFGKDFISYSRPHYQLWKGKRYPTRIDTLQDREEGEDFKSWVKLEYQEIEGFWLVKKLTYKFELAEGGARVVGPVEINLADCQINPPVSPDRFKQGKFKFINP